MSVSLPTQESRALFDSLWFDIFSLANFSTVFLFLILSYIHKFSFFRQQAEQEQQFSVVSFKSKIIVVKTDDTTGNKCLSNHLDSGLIQMALFHK